MLRKEKQGLGSGEIASQAQPERTQILVIEEDPHIQKILHRTFHEQGYRVTICGDVQAGLDPFREGRRSAVILARLLPTISGRDLCKALKSETPEVPVIVLSAIS